MNRRSNDVAEDLAQGEKATWDSYLTKTFVEICVDRVRAGDRPHTHFTPAGWKKIISDFAEKTGHHYTQVQFKNKWDGLRKEWNVWEKFEKGETGIGWDHVRDTFLADNEWWDRKIKEDKRVAKYRNRGIENRKLLRELFRGQAATGEHAYIPGAQQVDDTVGKSLPNSNDVRYPELVVDDDESDDADYDPIAEGGDSSPSPPHSTQPQVGSSRRRVDSQPPRRTQKKRAYEVRGDISNSLDRLVSFVESQTSPSTPPVDPYNMSSCCKILEEIPEIANNGPLLDFALWLFRSKAERENFLNITRKDWQIRWLRVMYAEKFGSDPPTS